MLIAGAFTARVIRLGYCRETKGEIQLDICNSGKSSSPRQKTLEEHVSPAFSLYAASMLWTWACYEPQSGNKDFVVHVSWKELCLFVSLDTWAKDSVDSKPVTSVRWFFPVISDCLLALPSWNLLRYCGLQTAWPISRLLLIQWLLRLCQASFVGHCFVFRCKNRKNSPPSHCSLFCKSHVHAYY